MLQQTSVMLLLISFSPTINPCKSLLSFLVNTFMNVFKIKSLYEFFESVGKSLERLIVEERDQEDSRSKPTCSILLCIWNKMSQNFPLLGNHSFFFFFFFFRLLPTRGRHSATVISISLDLLYLIL